MYKSFLFYQPLKIVSPNLSLKVLFCKFENLIKANSVYIFLACNQNNIFDILSSKVFKKDSSIHNYMPVIAHVHIYNLFFGIY